ncbi:hypothetical protein [Pseudochrobactrum sp. HB0163]|uniref:hypothetical protein n=1 Tax=Pseudochrobactrum sp. HB0163 TaxID=3450708 RepID=UPI003F6DD565
MSEIRNLTLADMPQFTRLFQKIFLKSRQEPSAELSDYLHKLYIGFAGEAEPASKVLVNDNDEIYGFIGAHKLDYVCEGKTLKTVIASSLMVDNHEQNPMGGARLIRSIFNSDYDLALTETASEVSAAMLKMLNAVQLTDYSLDWLRIIRPLGFAVETAGSKLPFLNMLHPAARILDERKRSRLQGKSLRWSATPQQWPAGQSLQCSEIDPEEFIALYTEFSNDFSARPQWTGLQLQARLQDALQKPDYGRPYMVKASAKTGRPVGLFLYHLQKGRTARVLELFSHAKTGSQVIDALIHHAALQGAVAIRGRTRPQMMEAMLGKRIAFTHLASTMVWAKDPAHLQPFLGGKALANGLAGEYWSRLTGNPL